jgi:hypothetical protein
MVFAPVALDVTFATMVRSFEVRGVPDGQSMPVRFTFEADVNVKVMSSTRQLEPIVRSVVLEVVFNCWTVTV